MVAARSTLKPSVTDGMATIATSSKMSLTSGIKLKKNRERERNKNFKRNYSINNKQAQRKRTLSIIVTVHLTMTPIKKKRVAPKNLSMMTPEREP